MPKIELRLMSGTSVIVEPDQPRGEEAAIGLMLELAESFLRLARASADNDNIPKEHMHPPPKAVQ